MKRMPYGAKLRNLNFSPDPRVCPIKCHTKSSWIPETVVQLTVHIEQLDPRMSSVAESYR